MELQNNTRENIIWWYLFNSNSLTLMILILASSFTGYLLPWDQTAYWAVTICLAMFDYLPIPMDLAITSNTLQIFFTLHTTLIPICFLVLLPLHFWKVRKARGIGLPEQGKASDGKPLVPTLPNLVSREITAGLILIALVMMLAAIFQAPLGDMANPGLSPNPAKAPWYFMGFQEMLFHFHPVVPVLLAPLSLLFFFCLIPYIKYPFSHPGIWFISRTGRTTGLISFFASILLTTAMVITDAYGFGDGLPGPGLMSMFLAVGIPAVTLWLAKRYGLCLNEVIQILVIQVVTIYLTLSLIGTLFRGEGMKLSGGFF